MCLDDSFEIEELRQFFVDKLKIYCCQNCRFMRDNECHKNPPCITEAHYGKWPKVRRTTGADVTT